MLPLSYFLGVISTALLASGQGVDTTGCDEQCMQSYRAALASEQAQWATQNISDDPFYDTPSNASSSKPGDVLRWQALSADHVAANWSMVPSGMSLARFLYVTEDIDRNPIPASAFVLLPYWPGTWSAPDASKFNTVVWAHGTAGRARQCAPSNNRQLYYGWEAPFFLASSGYAVVAPDYAGLGSVVPGEFHYEAGMIHAADVAYALVAARSVLGDILSDEWVVAGHSEGGMTAWRTNERLAMADQDALLKAGKLIGAVSAAPAMRPIDLIPKEIELAGDGPLGDIVSVYLLQSVTRIYSDLNFDDYINEPAKALLPMADTSCLVTGEALFANLTTAQIYKNTSWLTSPQFVDWQERFNGAGAAQLAAPMLVVQGLNDTLTYSNNTEWDFNRTCSAFPKSTAELYLVPELGHDPAFQAAQPYYIDWIRQRFAGVGIAEGCTTRTAVPVNQDFVRGQAG
ncbi:secretory lipase [Diaporthe sp. PMI_573]|nr:secretory lipase [Diaporthaceae sp. PMI_573]